MSARPDARPGRPALAGLVRSALATRRLTVAAIALTQLAAMAATLAQPAINARIVDNGVVAGDVGYVRSMSVVLLAATAVSALASFGGIVAGANLSADAAADLRDRVFRHLGRVSSADHHAIGTHSLLSRTSTDVAVISQAVFVATTLSLAAPIVTVGAVVLSLRESLRLSPVIAVTAVLISVCVGVFIATVTPLAARRQRAVDRVNRMLREQLSGMHTIRAFRRESESRDRFDADNAALTRLSRTVGARQLLLGPGTTALTGIASAITLLWGADLIESGSVTIGTLIAFTGYLGQVATGISLFMPLVTVLPRARASATRIAEVLDLATEDPAIGDVPAHGLPEVSFDAVSLFYPGAENPAIDSVTLRCPPGTTTAVVGGTSSGKSTLLRTVPRLIAPTAGTVRVAGLSVADWAVRDLRDRVALVSGRQIVAGTVRSNLRLAGDAADDALWEALRAARLADDVAARGGLDLEIAQGGSNLSGGQRQRLAVARAIVRTPDVLLLDDAFSAMDRETAHAVLAGIRGLLPNTTLVVATRQIDLIEDAPVIAVLDRGALTAVGRHRDLLGRSQVYLDLADAQRITQTRATQTLATQTRATRSRVTGPGAVRRGGR
ncbi:ABC transporter ATP-binding protein [Gordonia shandongensis]|uniref:ABC transporter ATP-binding protein n=1 Tax=Gordonia shandongensis TaxID=376351 RepID=UPI001FDF4F76|nr:ABC transporter ATP-binding protein [Gordonia shandongensis]